MKSILLVIAFILGSLYGVYVYRVANGACVTQWSEGGGYFQDFVDCSHPSARRVFSDDTDIYAATGFVDFSDWDYLKWIFREVYY